MSDRIVPAQYVRSTMEGKICYGTAGFRQKAASLPFVMFRMGILAVLRARERKAAIGVMITASHNPEEDNGVKLIDPLGEMLSAVWETCATEIANASNDDLEKVVCKIIDENKIDDQLKGVVLCAFDSRASSPGLRDAVKAGVSFLNGSFEDFGMLTTPQLHFIVRARNTDGTYGIPAESGYYAKLSQAFLRLIQSYEHKTGLTSETYIDCANGIGAPKLRKLLEHLHDTVPIRLCNDGGGVLNSLCGADYVKIQQCIPNGFAALPNAKCASIDGDADRIVYFYTDEDGTFHLLDGDKIGALFALFVQQLLSEANVDASFGIVQTAYANGSSTLFMQETLHIPVFCVPTGVKHLHKKAEEFDVGIYFEANGHGTILFSDKLKRQLSQDTNTVAARRFLAFIELINETVGDALADMLAVEAILYAKEWSIQKWDSIYSDFPSRQLKVEVKDRSVVQTTDAERRCVSPSGMQERIDSLVATRQNGRCFVRPSGTENVVRVYAEASTQLHADSLAADVKKIVLEFAG